MPISPQTRLHAAFIIIVLALLSVFPPLATDMYLPAIGQVAEAMDAPHSAAELSLSVFFLGLCLGQFIVGPLSDAFGRKLPLVGGTLLFTLTSIGLLMVDDIVSFNVLRFLQAIGACTGMAVGRAIVTDLYQGRAVAKVMTLLVTLMTIGPIISPFLGSVLLTALGWRSIFVTLIIVGVTALVLTLIVIPETLPQENRRPGAFSNALGHFKTLATRRRFIVPALVTAFIQAPIFAFITGSSGVFIGGFGMSASSYGVLFGVVASALVIFAQINNQLLNHFSPAQILSAGLPVFAGLAAVLLTVSGTQQAWVLVAALWCVLGMVGLLSANGMAIAMAGSPEAAGLGSAGLGSLQFAVAFCMSSLVALMGTATAVPMAAAMLTVSLVATGLWHGFFRRAASEQTAQEAAS
ncbi:Bcr/CflA family efflux MFS transporter [Aliishimia ponticola]|uniref:Bcr/CflA family efflux transporter n=1 Tax=Aliishimia ponticola TaxID=2499833 RepID=A0A4S4N8V1_9RHOB|nr:multidrug effflux MFS transporter [Aliishimia ponticola]THH35646.1 Bcr/CflA family efflux MFS transporter [Aliishimia ponticola]